MGSLWHETPVPHVGPGALRGPGLVGQVVQRWSWTISAPLPPEACHVTYPRDLERTMRAFYRSLRENDRRRYAAVEAAKLGHGGIEYISKVLGIDPKTIRQGQRDLDDLPEGPRAAGPQARRGSETEDRRRPQDRRRLPQGPRRAHRRQSHRRVADLDQPDQDRDRRSDARVWQLCQCAYRRSTARPAWLSRAEGPADGAPEPPSRSQYPIRDDRPAQARVPRFRQPDPQHRPESP